MDPRIQVSKILAAGIATCSLIGPGAGAGIIFGCLVAGTAANSQAKDQMFQYTILGFALTEAIGLLGLMMAFLLLFM